MSSDAKLALTPVLPLLPAQSFTTPVVLDFNAVGLWGRWLLP